MGEMFMHDMYLMANAGDFEGFMNGIVIVSLYLLLIGFSALSTINKRR